jgi:phage-related protein
VSLKRDSHAPDRGTLAVQGQESAQRPRLGCTFYKTEGGEEPVRSWLKDLPDPASNVIGRDLASIQWRWPVSMPLVGNLGDGLWEVRSTVGKVEYRVIFSVDDGEMYLLNGFQKSTRKTPDHERTLALKRKRTLE